MKALVAVLMLISMAVMTAPALVAGPAAIAEPEASNGVPTIQLHASAKLTTVDAVAPSVRIEPQKISTASALPRPANKQRSRRPARIDLTMPFYRFGKLPIRIKD